MESCTEMYEALSPFSFVSNSLYLKEESIYDTVYFYKGAYRRS